MSAFEFLAAIPNRKTPGQSWSIECADRPDLVCGESPRFWTSNNVPMIDLGDAGRIWGILFSKSSDNALDRLPARAPVGRGHEALAHWLVSQCWGGYVALLADGANGTLAVMVDPSGLFPVYRFKTRTHIILASHPDLIFRASRMPAAVSWQKLRFHLYWPELRQCSTCLDGITELGPGELLPIVDDPRAGRRIWRPDDFMPGDASMSLEEAAEQLKHLAVQMVGAWANVLGPVAVAASGGVDSSFICGALKCNDVPFALITVATADPSGDERHFVHILGEYLAVETVSAIYNPSAIDPRETVSKGMARPTRKTFMAALDAALFEAGQTIGAKTIFDGNGGDNLFCFLHSAAPIVDRLRVRGITRGNLSTFLDMCRVTGCDIPTMSRAVVRRLVTPNRFPFRAADTRLLTISTGDSERPAPLYPWLGTDVAKHSGKRDHLALIMNAQHHSHGLAGNGLPRFSPLMSQPLLEFCLAIPTWLWCEGGINRALARAAFASELPREIVMRTSKSGPDSFIRRSFVEHRPAIKEMLLDGLLAQNGVIDQLAVETALGTDSSSGDSIIYRLIDLLEAESWARSWTG